MQRFDERVRVPVALEDQNIAHELAGELGVLPQWVYRQAMAYGLSLWYRNRETIIAAAREEGGPFRDRAFTVPLKVPDSYITPEVAQAWVEIVQRLGGVSKLEPTFARLAGGQ